MGIADKSLCYFFNKDGFNFSDVGVGSCGHVWWFVIGDGWLVIGYQLSVIGWLVIGYRLSVIGYQLLVD